MAQVTTDHGMLRRDLLAIGAPVALGLMAQMGAAPATAAAIPDRTWLKLISDLNGRTVFSITEGMVWGFKPQADDLTIGDFAKPLYGYRSLLARKAQVQPDGAVRLRTKGWSFYLDVASREPITQLLNPYNGQTVSCPPLSGPMSTTTYGPGASAEPTLWQRRIGDRAWVGVDRISRFKPADTTWFKLEADMTTYACQAGDIDNPAMTHIPSNWSHSLVAEWQTWMKMHGEPGHILFNGGGTALAGPHDIPAHLSGAVERLYPGALAETFAWR